MSGHLADLAICAATATLGIILASNAWGVLRLINRSLFRADSLKPQSLQMIRWSGIGLTAIGIITLLQTVLTGR
jgi:hypothetical protein